MASLLARWPKPAQPSRARPLPRARASAASMHADGRAATPWHAGRTRPPRGAHATAWTRPGRPPGAPGRVRLRPRCQTRSSSRALTLSLARAAAAAPPLAFASDAQSYSPRQLQPPPSHLQPPATPPRPSAPCAHAQSRSVSPACPIELTGASRSSGDLSAPLLAFLCVLALPRHCTSFPVASARSIATRWPDHGEQRRRIRHSRRRGSSGARQVPKRARLDSSRAREAVGALGVAEDLTGGEIPDGLRPQKHGVADKWGRLSYGSRLSAPLRV